MRIGSLFSGYGGLDLAVAAHYGATVAWHVECDKWPSAILAHHYPDVPNYGDVTQVDWAAVEPVDIITGGFPCQDVSHAGLRRGIKPGTRSGLWEHFAYAISVLRPRLVVIENVAGLLSADAHCDVEPCPWCVGDEPDGHMRALGVVLSDLAEAGFDAEWGSVRASDAGAPHRRERVFIVAAGNAESRRQWGVGRPGEPEDVHQTRGSDRPSAADAGGGQLAGAAVGADGLLVAGERGGDPDGLTLLPTPKASDGPNGGPGMRNGRGVADALPGVVTLLPTPVSRDWKGRDQTDSDSCLPSVAPRVTTDFGPYTAAIRRWEAVIGRTAPSPTEPGKNGRPRLSPRFVEFLMGLPDGWVTGVDIPRTAQLKALGNGVVPQQAALALSVLSPRLAGAA